MVFSEHGDDEDETPISKWIDVWPSARKLLPVSFSFAPDKSVATNFRARDFRREVAEIYFGI